jgi:cytochrome c biogenesis protein CcmG, thiol:disulfide interchange protein DsbE
MLSSRGLLVTALVAFVLSIPAYFYWDFLTRGMRPPEGTQILNVMQKQGVPDFKLQTLKGDWVSLEDHSDKLVLINFWATWCAPCVKEFPSLQRLVKHFKGRLVVLAVSSDKNREDIEVFLRAFGGTPEHFYVLWDKDRVVTKLYGTDVLPESFIVAPGRRLVRKVVGEAVWDDPMALAFFEDLLSGRQDKRNADHDFEAAPARESSDATPSQPASEN